MQRKHTAASRIASVPSSSTAVEGPDACCGFLLLQMYVEENAQFQLKVVEKSGLNRDGTYLPPAIHPTFAKEPKYDMKTAMVEAEMVMGGVVADLLEKTGVH